MDQPANVAVETVKDRDFVHRVTTIMLKNDSFSRAWIEHFDDTSKISELAGFQHDPAQRKIRFSGGVESKYQSTVYFENRAPLIQSAMLLADVEGNVRFQISNDGGNSWMDARPGRTVYFSKADRRLVVRAFAKGASSIENIAVIW